jgi:hypothetical protein
MGEPRTRAETLVKEISATRTRAELLSYIMKSVGNDDGSGSGRSGKGSAVKPAVSTLGYGSS